MRFPMPLAPRLARGGVGLMLRCKQTACPSKIPSRGITRDLTLLAQSAASLSSFGRDTIECTKQFATGQLSARREQTKGAQMRNILLWIGRIAGIAGVLLSAWAATARLRGAYFAGSFQVGTLLLVGITGITIACFCLLFVITMRPRG